jgi:hypothetical protein
MRVTVFGLQVCRSAALFCRPAADPEDMVAFVLAFVAVHEALGLGVAVGQQTAAASRCCRRWLGLAGLVPAAPSRPCRSCRHSLAAAGFAASGRATCGAFGAPLSHDVLRSVFHSAPRQLEAGAGVAPLRGRSLGLLLFRLRPFRVNGLSGDSGAPSLVRAASTSISKRRAGVAQIPHGRHCADDAFVCVVASQLRARQIHR